ncbi:hypothetical protein MOQ_008882 [Trypanosoma cruzi marinkellei]|uniref:Uncharacterized protein n=1 Tax=Trypanosoma cruzi marinkellei TaxID=85056 RepID=K2LXJ6_TRYCR|nr:hypothetical protein MOQ_008882 [Trypanosoma cruzi marinkellei]
MRSKSHFTPPRAKCTATTAATTATTTVASGLPPKKVAELVRQLAESRYEAQQLRQQIQSLHQENASFRAVVLPRNIDGSIADVSMPQKELNQQRETTNQKQPQHEGGRPCAINGKVTTARNGSTVKHSGFMDQKITSPEKAQTSILPESIGMLLTPPSSSLKAAEEPSVKGVENLEKRSSSLEDSYWRKKYAKLKRTHEKALRERDVQLAEVQHLVYQIHEEHDELRHRHERDSLQRQLEIESRSRMSLEEKTKSLEEELLVWRQRFLHLVGETAYMPNHVMASEVVPTLGDTCDGGNYSSPPDGLNQTDRSFMCPESAPVSMIDADASPQGENALNGARYGKTMEKRKNDVEQFYLQKWRKQKREDVNTVDSHGIQNSSPRPFTRIYRHSVAVQVGPSTAAATSQTESCSQKSVGTFVDFGTQSNNANPGLSHFTGESEPTPDAKKKILATFDRNIEDLPKSHFQEKSTGSVSLFSPRTYNSRSLQDHVYYLVNQVHGRGNRHRTSSVPLCRQLEEVHPPSNPFAFPMASSSASMAGRGISTDDNQAKRDRLEEDIRKHDQLLEAVAKLQRRAQRVAKTPSF